MRNDRFVPCPSASRAARRHSVDGRSSRSMLRADRRQVGDRLGVDSGILPSDLRSQAVQRWPARRRSWPARTTARRHSSVQRGRRRRVGAVLARRCGRVSRDRPSATTVASRTAWTASLPQMVSSPALYRQPERSSHHVRVLVTQRRSGAEGTGGIGWRRAGEGRPHGSGGSVGGGSGGGRLVDPSSAAEVAAGPTRRASPRCRALSSPNVARQDRGRRPL